MGIYNSTQFLTLSVFCAFVHKVWRDVHTVNVIATATEHPSSSIVLAAVKFFLGQDTAEAGEDSDDEEEELERMAQQQTAPQVHGWVFTIAPSRADVDPSLPSEQ